MSGPADDITIRKAAPGDRGAVLSLLQASLGWIPDDLHARFFDWKHGENPFGPSPAWVAMDAEKVVGFRTFLRWEFERGGEISSAVRAVDTATHPDYQGRGLFSRLTTHALDELATEGVAFVFNTPNQQSRPGYLKMGWQVVGRPAIRARVRSMAALPRLVRARVAADKWSEPVEVGLAAAEVFADRPAVSSLLASVPARPGLATRRSPELLSWRYGFGPLAYRVLHAGDVVSDGVVVFRVRRRGPAREAAICDLLVPDGDRRLAVDLLGRVAREAGADYAVVLGSQAPLGSGFLPLPGQGPVLTWRGIADASMPSMHDWELSLGDIELF